MDGNFHSMTNLFNQLGLPSEASAIQAFIQSNRPLDHHLTLVEAPFWAPSQAEFLREQLQNDADWAVMIDILDRELRGASS